MKLVAKLPVIIRQLAFLGLSLEFRESVVPFLALTGMDSDMPPSKVAYRVRLCVRLKALESRSQGIAKGHCRHLHDCLQRLFNVLFSKKRWTRPSLIHNARAR